MTDAIEGRVVTMTSYIANPDGSVAQHQATDKVALADLEGYTANASGRWQAVVVGDEPVDIDPAEYTAPTYEGV